MLARLAWIVIVSNRLFQTWEAALLNSANPRVSCSAVRAVLSVIKRFVTTKTPWMMFSSAGEDDWHTRWNASRVRLAPCSMTAVASASLESKWW